MQESDRWRVQCAEISNRAQGHLAIIEPAGATESTGATASAVLTEHVVRAIRVELLGAAGPLDAFGRLRTARGCGQSKWVV